MKKFFIKNADKVEAQNSMTIRRPVVYCEGPEEMEVSDGYHTFSELYDHRIALYIVLCKRYQDFEYHGDARNNGEAYNHKLVWRSKLHSDGSSYDGWFILGINRDKGKQISYHLPLSKWEDTNFAETLEKAPEYDGHSSEDVIKRLLGL